MKRWKFVWKKRFNSSTLASASPSLNSGTFGLAVLLEIYQLRRLSLYMDPMGTYLIGDRTRLLSASEDRFVPDSTHYLLATRERIKKGPHSIKELASSRPKKARASLPFRLASRAYGSVGTVEQGSYSDTPPEEETMDGSRRRGRVHQLVGYVKREWAKGAFSDLESRRCRLCAIAIRSQDCFDSLTLCGRTQPSNRRQRIPFLRES
ncbi:hypothetical protein ACFE04_019591 [Oxalis oulophora]